MLKQHLFQWNNVEQGEILLFIKRRLVNNATTFREYSRCIMQGNKARYIRDVAEQREGASTVLSQRD